MTQTIQKPLERVLLVDDDEVTNLMHRRVVQRSQQVKSVEIATDGLQALEILRADLAALRPLPELIFLDINMPRMGGFEFLEEYAGLSIAPDAQLIIVMLSTSLLRADHERAAADPNVHCFAEKPLEAELLLKLIAEFQTTRAATSTAA